MVDTRAIFPRYFDILEENESARYIHCKYIAVSFDVTESTDDLWKKHNTALKTMKVQDVLPEQSLLDLKIELSYRIFKNCHFCERRCNVDRREISGECKVKESRVASEFLHMGEENLLVPSYTIFFSGCTFSCVFCQNWDISQHISGMYIDPKTMANMVDKQKNHGARNVNWVGGDPTSNLWHILKVLKECKTNIPQIWNSNMYCSIETMKLLDGIVDVYLTDFKYGNDFCAERLSKVKNYTAVIKRNHKIAHENCEMIVRHLVMPNHIECCSKPIIEWISDNLPNAAVNIMFQYRPEYKAYDYEDISRSVSGEEVLQVKEYV
ncbi:MAG: radical SAM protein, partial [Candidatus Asgardarchaeum californiense]